MPDLNDQATIDIVQNLASQKLVMTTSFTISVKMSHDTEFRPTRKPHA